MDLSKLDRQLEKPTSQASSLLWTKSPATSQPSLQLADNLHLDIPSDDFYRFDGFGSETDVSGPVHRRGNLARTLGLEFGSEEGVLLQPDFEFDEDGNLVELARRPMDAIQNTLGFVAETPLTGEVGINEQINLDLDLDLDLDNQVCRER